MAQPDLALSLLEELGLSQAVFAPPANLEPSAPRNGFDWAYGAAAARAAARVLEKRALSEMSAVDAADGGLDRNSAEYSTNEANGCAKDLMDDTGSSANVDPTVTSVDPGVEHTTAAGVDQIEVKGKEKGNSDANSTTGPEEKSNKSHKGGKGVKSDGVVTDKQDTLVRELFLSAALLPLAGVRHKFKKGKYVPAAQSVVQDSLKVNRTIIIKKLSVVCLRPCTLIIVPVAPFVGHNIMAKRLTSRCWCPVVPETASLLQFDNRHHLALSMKNMYSLSH